jgi:hypothetical protein
MISITTISLLPVISADVEIGNVDESFLHGFHY